MDIILSTSVETKPPKNPLLKLVSLEGTFARIDIKFIGTIIDKESKSRLINKR
jgi:hypothetical protein